MRLESENIYIRLFEESDAEKLLSLHVRNREFFRLYSCTRDESFYTLEYQLDSIRNSIEQGKADEKYAFGIFMKSSDELIGNVTLSEILRGHLQSCFIGYSLNKEHNGKGYMTEAVKLAVKFAFKDLGLHRIEAGVMPHNLGSIKVLEKAGFCKEGIARKNVNINGRWEDHQVLAIIEEDYIR